MYSTHSGSAPNALKLPTENSEGVLIVMSRQVLISYDKSDSGLVQRLDGDLIKRGINVWIDTRNVQPKQSKRQTIYEGIVSSDCFIPCLSPRFLEEEFCRTQLFLARAYNKQILPVLISRFSLGRSPRFDLLEAGEQYTHAVKGLEELDIVDFSGHYDAWGLGSYERNFEKLVDAIQPTPKPVPLNAQLLYVSYNYRDTDFATRLAKDLELARGRVWIDKLSIRLGSNWRGAMYEGLRTAHHFIVCVTPEAARSENVAHEVLVAKMRGIPIYPVIPERVHGDDTLKSQLESAIAESDAMKFLNDLKAFEPEPDYQSLLSGLKKAVGLTEPEGLRKQGIFISYRRADSQAMTGRIREKLVEEFGPETVFMDVDTIPSGEDFAEYYKSWLNKKAAVALVIIGEKWASMRNKEEQGGPPRLHKEDDHVRIEVATALAMNDLLVIPVLLEAADTPKSEDLPESLRRLSQLQGSKIRLDPDFQSDMKKLIAAIKKSQQR